jgi:hypothetical protein
MRLQSGGVPMSQMWRDPESAASAEKSQGGSGRVVAKALVGCEWVVVTMPIEGNEETAGDMDPDSPG